MVATAFVPAFAAVIFVIDATSSSLFTPPSFPKGPQNAQSVLDRAIADFEAGRIDESAAGFDRLIEMVPEFAPQLWQRGIVLYYAGRYDDCIDQFELHRTVNPNDVENAAWHFLCVARKESPEAAAERLLPVGPDPRVPMTEIYEMFRRERTPEAVLALSVGRPSAEFYAHLYIGLYYEALGRQQEAIEHMVLAAADGYARAGGYMNMVARVHVLLAYERQSFPAVTGTSAPPGQR